ncbi:hypothetical protein V1477_016135 [Vespula maculifrons]|uniref:Uncharacterized protein n=1 Tax=Vespula maculifrons TaxID=7453 RepID=A0ABD2BC66_VESMC
MILDNKKWIFRTTWASCRKEQSFADDTWSCITLVLKKLYAFHIEPKESQKDKSSNAVLRTFSRSLETIIVVGGEVIVVEVNTSKAQYYFN